MVPNKWKDCERQILCSRLKLLYVAAPMSILFYTVSEVQTLAGGSYGCLVEVWLPRSGRGVKVIQRVTIDWLCVKRSNLESSRHASCNGLSKVLEVLVCRQGGRPKTRTDASLLLKSLRGVSVGRCAISVRTLPKHTEARDNPYCRCRL